MQFAPVLIAALATFAVVDKTAAAQGIESLGWLAGCWQGHNGEPGTLEQWLPPAGGTMLGVSRTVKQGKTVEFEFMQLRHLPDGTLAFIAQPAGRPPTTFRLRSMGNSEAIFENPEHDFPQRVSYARPDASSLEAAIEGARRGTQRRIEFKFTRVSCDAQIPTFGK